jgi:hypothetical protein
MPGNGSAELCKFGTMIWHRRQGSGAEEKCSREHFRKTYSLLSLSHKKCKSLCAAARRPQSHPSSLYHAPRQTEAPQRGEKLKPGVITPGKTPPRVTP